MVDTLARSSEYHVALWTRVPGTRTRVGSVSMIHEILHSEPPPLFYLEVLDDHHTPRPAVMIMLIIFMIITSIFMIFMIMSHLDTLTAGLHAGDTAGSRTAGWSDPGVL